MVETDRPATDAEIDRDVAVLDHALWSTLEAGDDLVEVGAAWLALLCQRIKGAERAVLILKSELHGQMEPVAYWPKGRAATPGLSAAAETALHEDRGVARAPKSDRDARQRDRKFVDIARPIRMAGETVGIVALEIDHRPKEALAAAMRELQWGAAWITTQFGDRESRKNRLGQERLRLAIEIFAVTLARPSHIDAARTFATELATELDCERVTVTRYRGRGSKAIALSHSASFDRRTNLVRAIEDASDESIDQWRTIVHPTTDNDGLTRRAHERLVTLNGGLAILATPLSVGDRPTGGLLLERQAEQPFSADEALFVEALAALAGPALEEKRRNDRPLVIKALIAVWALISSLLGPRHLGLKLAVAAASALLFVVSAGTVPFRVTADARLSGVMQRAASAPFDGYLEEAEFGAGDIVTAGQVLARLDTQDLELERLRRLSERSHSMVEFDRALAESDAAGLNILRARIAQSDAQIALLDAQISRTSIVAPFDGFLVSGDLSQRIGDAVARGEILFEIAPLAAYRVEIAVDERDVEEIRVGQNGRLSLAAFPEAPLDIEVIKITPLSGQEDGLNFFRVDASFPDAMDTAQLRPGMEGVAKISVEDRRIIWVWTHRLVDWLRMTWWRWS